MDNSVLTFGEKGNPAIVFFHGWGGGFSSFLFFAQQLSKKYFCVVFDFNKMINSAPPKHMEDFAHEVKSTLDELNVTCAFAVGHSFGGRVIAKTATIFPEIFKKIVLVDSAGLPPRRSLWYHIKVRWFKLNVRLARAGLIKTSRLARFGSRDYMALNSVAKQTFKNVVNENLTPCFASIRVPTLIFWGEKDRETPPVMAKKLNKIIKDSGIVWINGAGHFSYLDAPQLFRAAILEFFK